ncbi:ABC transporter substrate-binding protein [Lederbergia sp. NSJ-179]|uniref:ABC transporter substrate-binding protein n=1 Tax=Lederbergia sp. NSJ-179 TaxID=2931402 RepID=UPI001FD471B9|nr:ABC transporter substrate-binding protein [Lederbergia sp. NSJ-179]MCJ7842077.1 ABC transporter substrate-binding protein [Lederbergia sp. NSJ-179]
MFRRKWPLWSLILVLVVGITLAGCSSETGKKGDDGDKSKSSDEPITLTFFNADLTSDVSFDDEVAKKITEKTGVILDIQHPVGGDEQAIPLMIASGEYPDLIYAKGDIGKLIEAGGVIKLDDLIEEKGDNLKKMYGDQLDRLRNSIDDPSIYGVGTYGVENAYWKTSGTMSIQLDVLRELGYPEIKTLEDYENALTDYIAKNPEIDGQKTIGLSLLGSDWRWLITLGNPAGFALGIQDDGQWAIDDETGEATYKFTIPEIKEYFKWLNHMNDIGLLDPESFTQTHDTYISKLSSGRVLGIADQDWNYGDADKALKADGKEWRTYAPLPVTLNENYKSQGLKDYGFAGGGGISISSTSEHQEKAFEFLDWMASEEAQILVNWGIEGENYDVIDGKRVLQDDDKEQRKTDAKYPEKTGVGQYVYPFPQWGNGAVDSTGNPISPDTQEDIIAAYTDAEKEALGKYGMESWIDWFPSTEELGISNHGAAANYTIPNNSDLQIIQQKADDYTEQKITQAILGKPADFDAAWDEMQEKLIEMDIEKANKEMTKITQDTMKLWGTK